MTSREARVARQRKLLEANPGLTLLCLTVQPPGPVKRNRSSLIIAEAGVRAVREAFCVGYEELRDLETGFEAFFLVDLASEETKRVACSIEDTHPLGRLMDIDVIVPMGQTSVKPIGREEIGLEPRRCLLCDRTARECMRTRIHSTQELLDKYEETVKSYLKL